MIKRQIACGIAPTAPQAASALTKMKISVRVQPKAKQEKIEEVGPNELKVYFNVPPEQGKANAKLVEMLAEYYQVSKSDVYIVTGSRSQSKVVEIFNLE